MVVGVVVVTATGVTGKIVEEEEGGGEGESEKLFVSNRNLRARKVSPLLL